MREGLVDDYRKYVRSFFEIADERIEEAVEKHFCEGELWPEPLLQLNPTFEPGATIDDLVDQAVLDSGCRSIFRAAKDKTPGGITMRLHSHQDQAIRTARTGASYVLTTGTGSGKSLAYIIPIVDHILRNGGGKGVQAVVVYPMNALANSQMRELEKFLGAGPNKGPVTFERYTGQEDNEKREKILASPPDILLTNYVMMELILTRWRDKALIDKSKKLRFIVLDELHTYRGRQGADVAMLIRRVREAFHAEHLQCVGTSATMAGPGSVAEQQEEVARVAARLFGSEVLPASVIGETLTRSTVELDYSNSGNSKALATAINGYKEPASLKEYYAHPVSSWMESFFGLEKEAGTGRLKRRKPRAIGGASGAAADLATVAGADADMCANVIREHLLSGYTFEDREKNGQPPFAFRIHQFFSRGDSVYASVEQKDKRYITVHGQHFVPEDRSRILLPLVFCRECGAEYYCVSIVSKDGGRQAESRSLSSAPNGEGTNAGYLMLLEGETWSNEEADLLSILPDDFHQFTKKGEITVRKDARDSLPRQVSVLQNGRLGEGGTQALFIPTPFRFCPHCGVAYSARGQGDFGKLATLGTEGRSSVITLLSLSMVRMLKADKSLPQEARKLLSFTDNRQDAALQAGHFNDFVQVSLLRSALYRSVAVAGPSGIAYDRLVQAVFDALDLPFSEYAKEPDLTGTLAVDSTRQALREVIGYRIYRDLERGWRILLPNLEQCGLLAIEYRGLEELCVKQSAWTGVHEALETCTPVLRAKICRTLLEIMRRGLALSVEYLDSTHQEMMRTRCRQHLKEEDETPWTIGDSERLFTATTVFPASRARTGNELDIFLSGLSGFGQFLRRVGTFPALAAQLGVKDAGAIIVQLLEVLRKEGIVESAGQTAGATPIRGYRLKAAAMLWRAGDGTVAPHDPVRMPRIPGKGLRINPFFVQFYREVGLKLRGYEAREHTAQVSAAARQDREMRFGSGALSTLYASATLELGVDIKDLNAVNMRNIPPTPANYAQRSGRAGRNGQPALVFSYCSTFRNHDQYFFRRPLLMVAGAVSTPRIDLANEDLVMSHVHSIWLSTSGVDLRASMVDVVDTADISALAVQPSVAEQLKEPGLADRAKVRVSSALKEVEAELRSSGWYHVGWIDEVLAGSYGAFETACERWRTLYRTARKQVDIHTKTINDHARSAQDKKRSKSLRAEAEAQIELLTSQEGRADSDFYTYRYFASEGFLPGYNFPRLPLSAYIPGKRGSGAGKPDQFLSRPRFLAVSEFGPRALVYHDGSRYRIDRVLMETNDGPDGGATLPLARAKICPTCGYLHVESEVSNTDLCELCKSPLTTLQTNLFRMQNVSTRRMDRINSDEEERSRTGYEIVTTLRFSSQNGEPRCKAAELKAGGVVLAKLIYGPAAEIWRINKGWRHRKEGSSEGFNLDVERGYWEKNQADVNDADDNPLSHKVERVVPYVEDRRNCLLVQPTLPEAADENEETRTAWMASFEAAFRGAIREEFQLEDAELASEPLPGAGDRSTILLYEAAEGGAGVLKQLVEDPEAARRVARQALEICHFDPETGENLGMAKGAAERCEAACYDCLMSYTNQSDHAILDRALVKDWFFSLRDTSLEAAPGVEGRSAHLKKLIAECGSELEKQWLAFIDEKGCNLPTDAQYLIESCKTRPDFYYSEHKFAIYIDGPIHDFPDRAARDKVQENDLEAAGYWVVRFVHSEDWMSLIKKYPAVFGGGKA
jgi:hypothetical protein